MRGPVMLTFDLFTLNTSHLYHMSFGKPFHKTRNRHSNRPLITFKKSFSAERHKYGTDPIMITV